MSNIKQLKLRDDTEFYPQIIKECIPNGAIDASKLSSDLMNLLNGKANASDVYTKNEVYNTSEIDALLSVKANAEDVYTKAMVNNLLSFKVDETDFAGVKSWYDDLHSRITTYLDNTVMQGAVQFTDILHVGALVDIKFGSANKTLLAYFDEKANANNVYTKQEIDLMLNERPRFSDVYTRVYIDNLMTSYYTKTEIDTLISNDMTIATYPEIVTNSTLLETIGNWFLALSPKPNYVKITLNSGTTAVPVYKNIGGLFYYHNDGGHITFSIFESESDDSFKQIRFYDGSNSSNPTIADLQTFYTVSSSEKSTWNDKQDALTTASVTSGTLNEAIGFDSNGNVVRGSAGGGGGDTIQSFNVSSIRYITSQGSPKFTVRYIDSLEGKAKYIDIDESRLTVSNDTAQQLVQNSLYYHRVYINPSNFNGDFYIEFAIIDNSSQAHYSSKSDLLNFFGTMDRWYIASGYIKKSLTT